MVTRSASETTPTGTPSWSTTETAEMACAARARRTSTNMVVLASETAATMTLDTVLSSVARVSAGAPGVTS